MTQTIYSNNTGDPPGNIFYTNPSWITHDGVHYYRAPIPTAPPLPAFPPLQYTITYHSTESTDGETKLTPKEEADKPVPEEESFEDEIFAHKKRKYRLE